jgi:hypothetical protein
MGPSPHEQNLNRVATSGSRKAAQKRPMQKSLALENGAIVADRHQNRRAEFAPVRTPIDSCPASSYSQTTGWVAEWFKAPVLKTGVRETVPGVRIPPQPPFPLTTIDNQRRRRTFRGFRGSAVHCGRPWHALTAPDFAPLRPVALTIHSSPSKNGDRSLVGNARGRPPHYCQAKHRPRVAGTGVLESCRHLEGWKFRLLDGVNEDRHG